ncbi:hypothetical protein ACPEEZ_13900 [Frigoribacterium sp. 2-23]|uniref:hypothetical protein n=1 Tax=Frigoribacterium sp. 2-23 TaxID=3415006 RepID=UPI003C70586F
MNKTTLTRGAFALMAAITLSATMGTGSPSSAASTADPAATSPQLVRSTPSHEPSSGMPASFPWLAETGPGEYLAGPNAPYLTEYTDADAARAHAEDITVIPDTDGRFRLKGSEYWLTYENDTPWRVQGKPSGDGPDALWTMGRDGRISPVEEPSVWMSGTWSWGNYTVMGLGTGAPASFIDLTSLTAEVDSVDVAAGTARIGGAARPGAVITSGTARATTDGTGTWSMTVGGLEFGSNDVSITASDPATEAVIATVDLTIDRRVADLSATATFADAVTTGALFSGSAEPGATVTITSPGGVATAARASASGAFTTEVAGPGEAGVQRFTVTQTIAGHTFDPTYVSLDYGSAVTIDAPTDGADFPGGYIEVRGAGLTGGMVRLLDNGTPLATGVVTDGRYSLTAEGLDDGEHVLTAKQTGRGNNVTVATVTVNPGKTATPPVDRSLRVTSPHVEDGYVTGKATTFTGKASPGSRITVTNKWGTSLGEDVTVDLTGDWTFTRVMTGHSIYYIDFIETTVAGQTNIANFYGFTALPPAEASFVVTSPKISDGYVSGHELTFTGRASAGSTIAVTNKWGTSLGDDVTVDDTGNWAFTRMMTGTSTYLIVFTETTTSGATNIANLFGLAPRE